MNGRYALRLFAAFTIVVVGAIAMPEQPIAVAGVDILSRIRDVAHVISAEEADSSIPGTRFFRVEFEQPVDHANPDGPKFRQRLTILHRNETAPIVFEISGYFVDPGSVQYELTSLLQGNQIHVEHRYFIPSRPDPVDWPHLDIAQSAADHHEIVQAFRAIYTAKWVSTGASKGGMASIYFRYFYPEDVDATVPYVAPSSHGTQDPRYIAFVASRGTAKCQKKLLAFQKRALKKRAKLIRYMGDGPYDVLGMDRALEFAILELPFVVWQYYDVNLCDEIPGRDASARQIYDFLDRVVFVSSYADESLTAFEPYYYQSATQLGGPAVGEMGLDELLHYPGQDGPGILPPLGVPKTFDPSVMPLIEQFVLEDAERMMFIYGANDPWSTNAFDVNASLDSYRLFVTGLAGNHGAQILDLSDTDRIFALGKISQWLDAPVTRATKYDVRSDPRYRIDRPTRAELFLR